MLNPYALTVVRVGVEGAPRATGIVCQVDDDRHILGLQQSGLTELVLRVPDQAVRFMVGVEGTKLGIHTPPLLGESTFSFPQVDLLATDTDDETDNKDDAGQHQHDQPVHGHLFLPGWEALIVRERGRAKPSLPPTCVGCDPGRGSPYRWSVFGR